MWADDIIFTIGQRYDVVILAYGRHLYCMVNEALLFHVEDGDLATGRVGLYCWANADCHFEKLTVDSLETDPLLETFTAKKLADERVEDAVDAVSGPSAWEAVGEAIVQNIRYSCAARRQLPVRMAPTWLQETTIGATFGFMCGLSRPTAAASESCSATRTRTTTTGSRWMRSGASVSSRSSLAASSLFCGKILWRATRSVRSMISRSRL